MNFLQEITRGTLPNFSHMFRKKHPVYIYNKCARRSTRVTRGREVLSVLEALRSRSRKFAGYISLREDRHLYEGLSVIPNAPRRVCAAPCTVTGRIIARPYKLADDRIRADRVAYRRY